MLGIYFSAFWECTLLAPRVERHIIKASHYLYEYCDHICFKSKNLYNYSNYLTRQEFINNGRWLRFYDLDKKLKSENQLDYRSLPAQSSQQVLRLQEKNWKSFFNSVRDWKNNPSKYTGRPRLPKYKKKNGRFITIFTNQQCKLREGFILLPGGKKLQTKITSNPQQVRIIPKGTCYYIEVVYKINVPHKSIKEPDKIISIDLGVDNLATIVNNIGLTPIIINGRILKSVNQFYNKKRSLFMSYIKDKGMSKKLQKLHLKRNCKVEDYIHKSSRYIINYCLENKIDTIIIGNNKDWKREIDTGKVNNQKFVSIPFKTFIRQIKYKAEAYDLNVIITEESYTSKASFLDKDPVPVYSKNSDNKYTFSGKRIKRGLYKSGDGILINADCNGAYNVLKKVIFKSSLEEKIEGVGLHPVRINPSYRDSYKGVL
ncbi:MAG: transposase, partial [Elusimicrobiota bacterium]